MAAKEDKGPDLSRRNFFKVGGASVVSAAAAPAAPHVAEAISALGHLTKVVETAAPSKGMQSIFTLLGNITSLPKTVGIPQAIHFTPHDDYAVRKAAEEAITQCTQQEETMRLLEALAQECPDMSATTMISEINKSLELSGVKGDAFDSWFNRGRAALEKFVKDGNYQTVGELSAKLLENSRTLHATATHALTAMNNEQLAACRAQGSFSSLTEKFKELFPGTDLDAMWEARSEFAYQMDKASYGYHQIYDYNIHGADIAPLERKLNEHIGRAIEAGESHHVAGNRARLYLESLDLAGKQATPDTIDSHFFDMPAEKIEELVEASFKRYMSRLRSGTTQLPAPKRPIERSLQGFTVQTQESDDGKSHYIITPDNRTLPSAIKIKLENIFSTKGTDYSFTITPELDERLNDRGLRIVTDSPAAIATLKNIIETQQQTPFIR